MKNFILALFSMIIAIPSTAQIGIEWEQNYGSSQTETGQSIQATFDGGFILVGSSNGTGGDVTGNYGNTDVWLVKTNSSGDIEWEKNYGGNSTDQGYMVIQTPDSGYAVIGNSSSSNGDVASNNGMLDMWFFKTDENGNLLWEHNYGSGLMNGGYSVQIALDGGFILGGFTNGIGGDVASNNGKTDLWLVKTDAFGNLEWEKNFGGLESDYGLKAMPTSDGGYIMLGHEEIYLGNTLVHNGALDYYVVKTDSAGTMEWEQYYGGSSFDRPYDFRETNDGGFILVGSSSSNQGDVSGNNGFDDVWLVKINGTGALQWEQNYGGSSPEQGRSVQQTTDGGYIVLGQSESDDFDVNWNNGSGDYWLFKTDSLGNLEWENSFGGSQVDWGIDFLITSDQQIVSIGQSTSDDGDVSGNNGGSDFWLVKSKSYVGRIYGNIYVDENEDCTFNTGDTTYAGVVVVGINDSTQYPVYGYTNAQGSYVLETDTTSYSVHYALPSTLFGAVACSQDTQSVQLSDSIQQDTLDFYVDALVDCALLTVDMSTPLLRRCMTSNYIVSYCNEGTIASDSAYVIVDFDPNIIVDSTSIPADSLGGNSYAFPIGEIGLFECGSFSVSVTVECDSTFIGQILCSEAHIYPDSVCQADTSSWTGAELRAKATCIGTDSVEFELKNIGSGNMGSDVPIIAIEDVILIIDDLVQLNSGAIKTWTVPINGNTQRIIAGQPANHPILSFTTDAVSFCNKNGIIAPGPLLDTSFLAYPNDEEAPYIAIDCQEIIGAYDPNDKSVSPRGVSSQHFITEKMDLEYKIRFQNTGNDTAFTVYITDSISSLLDITTIRPGAASHPYVMDIYGNGVVKFTFDNILLVDSFTNEPESHGFVQYKISQKDGNQVGDIINNNADIFFDFNPAIRTNTVFNKIGGIVLDTMIYEEPVGIRNLATQSIQVYPNPAKDFMIFDLGEQVNTIGFELYDLTGRLMHQTISSNKDKVRLDRNQLPAGAYFFKIRINNEAHAHGTVIFK